MKSFTSLELLANLESEPEKINWFLWHGNAFEALQRLDWIYMDIECYEPSETPHPKRYKKLEMALSEFST